MWSRSSTRSRRDGRRGGVGGHLYRVGHGEPDRGAVLEAGVRRLVGHHGRAALGEDAGRGVGSPPVLGRDGSPGHRGAAARRDRAGAADGHRVRAGPVRAGVGHDQLRHLHRLHQRPRPDRPARQGETETHRSAAGRVGVGRDPRRRGAGGVARLPRRPPRRHPVRHGDRGTGGPLPAVDRVGGVVDRGLRRRAELPRQPRHRRGVRVGVRRVAAAVGPPRPARGAPRPPTSPSTTTAIPA